MRTALFFQDGNFVGREYYQYLTCSGLAPDFLVAVGQFKSHQIEYEQERTGGGWNPNRLPKDIKIIRFDKLSDPGVLKLIIDQKIDVIIQGGVGLINNDIIRAVRIGIINVHPGKLPEFRGCSAPEWAIYHNKPVYATAHIIDEGLDTGPVILSVEYKARPGWSYEEFRANIYRHCAKTLVEALKYIENATPESIGGLSRIQDETHAKYWDAIPPKELEVVKGKFVARI